MKRPVIMQMHDDAKGANPKNAAHRRRIANHAHCVEGDSPVLKLLRILTESARSLGSGPDADRFDSASSSFEVSEVAWSEWEDSIAAMDQPPLEPAPQVAPPASPWSRTLRALLQARQPDATRTQVTEVDWSTWEDAVRRS